MGFNFGAFAGGLATGIQKGEELRLRREAQERQTQQYAAKLQQDKNTKLGALGKEAQEIVSGLASSQVKALGEDSPEMSEKSYNAINQDIGSQLLALRERAMTAFGDDKATSMKAIDFINNIAKNADFTEIGIVEVDERNVLIKNKEIADDYRNNPNQYKIDDANSVWKLEAGENPDNPEWVKTGVKGQTIKYDDKESMTTVEVVGKDGKKELMSKRKYLATPEDKRRPLYEKDKGVSLTKGAMVAKAVSLNKKLNDGSITAEEKIELETIQKAYGMEDKVYNPTDFEKKVKIFDKIAGTVAQYIDDPSKLKNLKKSDINKMKLEEAKVSFKGLGEAERKVISGTESSLNAGKLLVGKIDEIKNEEINRGLVDSIKQKVTTLLSDNQWENMDDDKKEKALLTIGLNTSLGNALAQYIKSISGTAVAQAEYDRLREVFTTGDYSNLPSLKKSIQSFYADLENSYVTKLRDSSSIGGSFILSKMKNYQDKYGNMPTPYEDGKKKKTTSANGQSVAGFNAWKKGVQ